MKLSTPVAVATLAALVLLSSACSPSELDGEPGDGARPPCGGLVAGDLVITEVMANPSGEDRGFEYFELYNASPGEVDLAGAVLVYRLPGGQPDDADEETHEIDGLVLDAGGYAALGTAEPGAPPDFLDYGFGADLGTLRNAGAVLGLRCGDDLVDRTEYPSAEGREGVASILDGAVPPDSIANDDQSNFCSATTEFAPGLLGSPGHPNEPCTPVPMATCVDGGVERAATPPAVGDLVIAEFMASPDGADDTHEWFEIHALRAVDLNRLVLARDGAPPTRPIDRPECVHLAAGSHALFARSTDAAANGGLPPAVGTFSFPLAEGRALSVQLGDQVLDQITLTGVEEGASRALDPAQIDSSANDDPAHWASCHVPYGDATLLNQGTPGADNTACGAAGTCLEEGVPRPIEPPAEGQIRVTEVLANPAGTGRAVDPGHEWFEIEAYADFDMNGLELGKAGAVEQVVSAPSCLRVKAGSRLVVAESAEPDENGGLPAVDLLKRFQLANTGGSVFVGVAGAVLHELPYGNAAEGRATQLDEAGAVCAAPALEPYNPDGDRGTPGAANPACSGR